MSAWNPSQHSNFCCRSNLCRLDTALNAHTAKLTFRFISTVLSAVSKNSNTRQKSSNKLWLPNGHSRLDSLQLVPSKPAALSKPMSWMSLPFILVCSHVGGKTAVTAITGAASAFCKFSSNKLVPGLIHFTVNRHTANSQHLSCLPKAGQQIKRFVSVLRTSMRHKKQTLSSALGFSRGTYAAVWLFLHVAQQHSIAGTLLSSSI